MLGNKLICIVTCPNGILDFGCYFTLIAAVFENQIDMKAFCNAAVAAEYRIIDERTGFLFGNVIGMCIIVCNDGEVRSA